MIRLAPAVAMLSWTMSSAVTLSARQADDCATLIETVRDRATLVPLAGATVTASWLGGNEVRVRTDSLGRARICGPADKLITIRVAYQQARSGPHTTTLSLARVTEHISAVDAPGIMLRGSVTETGSGAPIQNVAIRIANSPLIAFTDAEGRFYLQQMPIGVYTLEAIHISYSPVKTRVDVGDQDINAEIKLSPAAIALEPIIVTTFSKRLERVGFYERQKRGVGTFLGRKQIDAMNVSRASDLLRNVPSARLIPLPPRRQNPQNATLGRGGCRFKFIVDGTRTLADFEMDFLSAHAIEGVEVYSGLAEVPAIFRAASTPEAGSPLCGVVAIWTKDSR